MQIKVKTLTGAPPPTRPLLCTIIVSCPSSTLALVQALRGPAMLAVRHDSMRRKDSSAEWHASDACSSAMHHLGRSPTPRCAGGYAS